MDMTVDCSFVLSIPAMISADACAAARATLRAAEIQAKGTRHAGTLGLLAGLGALVAGSLAFWVALSQQRADQKAKEIKVKAYRRLVTDLARLARTDVMGALLVSNDLNKYSSKPAHFEAIFRMSIEFMPENFERNAILPTRIYSVCVEIATLSGQLRSELQRLSGANIEAFLDEVTPIRILEDLSLKLDTVLNYLAFEQKSSRWSTILSSFKQWKIFG